MAHNQQIQYISKIKNKYPTFFIESDVLEIGSLNINGTIRVFFDKCKYIGVDVDDGQDVDFVCEGQNLNFSNNFFDTTISCECFEHNPYWLETFLNMYRMTKQNGLIVFTCATTGREEHGTNNSKKWASPLTKWNYYRNLTEKDFLNRLNFNLMFDEYKFETNDTSKDLYFYGIKKIY